MSSRRPCPDPFNVSLSHKHIISYSVKYALTGGENPIALTEMSIVIKNVSTVGCHIWGPGPRFFFFCPRSKLFLSLLALQFQLLTRVKKSIDRPIAFICVLPLRWGFTLSPQTLIIYNKNKDFKIILVW